MPTTFRLRQQPEPARDAFTEGGSECLRSAVVRVVAAGDGEALIRIAQSPSMRLVCAALGVPRRDWGLFSRWAETCPDPRSVDLLGAYVDVMIADRCRKPTDDLVSDLIAVEVGGSGLTADELRAIVVALVTT